MIISILSALNTPDFSIYIQKVGYIGIFIWFITFDQLTPLPEEISLLVIGYLVAQGIFNPVVAGIASVLGFLTIDIIYYHLAKAGSKFLEKKTKNLNSAFVSGFRDKLKNHLGRTLIVLCFIPRMRLFAPILVGSMKMPFKRFLLFDTIGLSIFTTIYLSLGIIFHDSISSLSEKMKGLQHIIFFVFIGITAIIIIVTMRRIIKEKGKAKEETGNEA